MPNSLVRSITGERWEGACRKACALALALVLAFGAAAGPLAPSAFADVRKGDVIVDSTVEDRGIAAARCPSIDADFAMVVDSDGKVYFERDADAATQIASITKVMTAVVALDSAPLDTQVTVSKLAAEVGESSAGLREGDVMPLKTALYALMLPSGNDAAIAIAESVGQLMLDEAAQSGSQITKADGSAVDPSADDAALQAFVAAMNAKASELGCEDTLFTNPHGLDDGRWEGDLHSTASDVAKIAAYAMQNEDFRDSVSHDTLDIQVTRDGASTTITLESTDELLGVYEGACGIKTGFTERAGECFAGAAQRDGKELYAIVLHSTSESQRFTDTETLFDWVFDNLVDYQLAQSDETTSMNVNGQQQDVPVVAEVAHTGWTDRTIKATLADPSQTVEVFALEGNVSQSFEFYDVSGDVHAGDVIGKATFYQHNNVIATADVVACEDVAGPNIFESIGIWWDRVVRGFTGAAGTAESVVLNQTPLIYDKQASVIS